MAHKPWAVFTGGSGQMAVMAELLLRNCNAAVPHVDVGMDLFAFLDEREEVARIQVKTARGVRSKKGRAYSAKFGVPMRQLSKTDAPRLFYALAVRLYDGWGRFIVIGRTELKELWNSGCGRENKKSGDLELRIRFRVEETDAAGTNAAIEDKLTACCGKFVLTKHINAWESLPPLKTPRAIDADEVELPQA